MKIKSRFIGVLGLQRFRVNLSLAHRLSMSLGKRGPFARDFSLCDKVNEIPDVQETPLA